MSVIVRSGRGDEVARVIPLAWSVDRNRDQHYALLRAAGDEGRFPLLSGVDPYDDTTFNVK